MNAREIITLITLILGLLGAIGALIPTAIKLFDALKKIVKDKNWAQISSVAYRAVQSAEQTGKSGEEKKKIAINVVIDACDEMGVEVDEKLLQDIGDLIDDIIEFFNNMTVANKTGKKIAKTAQNKEGA